MIKVVTGAGASGKSSFAESLLEQSEAKRKIYAATMIVWDDECRARVKKHRQMREKKGFETAERPVDLGELFVPEDGAVLVECMSNLVANEMFREDGFHPEVAEKITEGVKNLLSQAKHVVIVGILYEEESEQYKKELGQINQKLAEMAEAVVEVVYGIPVWHKGGKEA